MNVLVVAAHPDDETLGAGCAIARHVRAGDKVSVLLLTDGASARRGTTLSDSVKRRNDAKKAADILGYHDLHFHNFPDNAMDSVPLLDVAKVVESTAAAANPRIVYIHHTGDLNVDHKVAARAALTCFRPQPGSTVRRILAFEVPSATGWDYGEADFRPNVFLDAGDLIALKLKALGAYKTEMRPFPHARSLKSVEARARAWGSQIGLKAVEPFALVREISP
jgi:N-acetylglucosamine malate deacetylase 1